MDMASSAACLGQQKRLACTHTRAKVPLNAAFLQVCGSVMIFHLFGIVGSWSRRISLEMRDGAFAGVPPTAACKGSGAVYCSWADGACVAQFPTLGRLEAACPTLF